MPLVRPLAYLFWGEARTGGIAPLFIFSLRQGVALPHIRRQSRRGWYWLLLNADCSCTPKAAEPSRVVLTAPERRLFLNGEGGRAVAGGTDCS